MTENWLPVVGFEGLYEVSDHGGVRSIERIVPTKSGRMHKYAGVVRRTFINHKGDRYRYVRLSKNGIVTTEKVHLLVIRAFIGPSPSPLHQACHGDGNRANASASNLRWGTAAENAADRMLHGTQVWGEKAHGAKLTEEAVRVIRSSDRDSAYLARQYGVSRTAVAKVRHGLSWARS